MLRNLLPILLMVLFTAVNAQTEKGRFAVSGGTDLSFLAVKTKVVTDSTNMGEIKTKSFTVNPAAAYFVADNLAVGISGTFTYDRTDRPGSMLGYTHSWSAGVLPSITYFFPVEGKLRPSAGVGAGYLWVFDEEDLQGLSLNGNAGVSYFVNRNVSFDLGLQYTHNTLKDNQQPGIKYKQNGVGALFGISVFF